MAIHFMSIPQSSCTFPSFFFLHLIATLFLINKRFMFCFYVCLLPDNTAYDTVNGSKC